MWEPSLGARLGAEFLGTFWLVFGGCGSAVLAEVFLTDERVQLGIGFVGVSLAFGLTAVFLYIILGATDDRAPKGFAPIAVGLGLTVIHLVGDPGDQPVGEPGPFAWGGVVRRGCGAGPGVALPGCPGHRRGHCRRQLRGHHRSR